MKNHNTLVKKRLRILSCLCLSLLLVLGGVPTQAIGEVLAEAQGEDVALELEDDSSGVVLEEEGAPDPSQDDPDEAPLDGEEAEVSTQSDPTIVASGTCGTCPWEITTDGVLSIGAGTLEDPYYNGFNISNWPWHYVENCADEPIVDIDPDEPPAQGSQPREPGGNPDSESAEIALAVQSDEYALQYYEVAEVRFTGRVIAPSLLVGMFHDFSSLQSIEGLSNLDASAATNVSWMFYGCSSLTSLDASVFDMSKVKNMRYMFGSCSTLTSLDLSTWDVSKVEDMHGMFSGCSKLETLNLRDWKTTSVTDMSSMFAWCTSLSCVTVGSGYAIKGAGMFPEATAVNGKWWSTTEGKWYTQDEIVAARSGIADTYWNVEPMSLSSCTVTLSPSSYTYDGTQKTPTITVKDGSTTLAEGTHYTVSWPGGRTGAGTYTATVAGKGSYSGKKSASFTINPKSLDACTMTLSPSSYAYDGTQKNPTITLKDGSKALVSGTDYDITTTPSGRTNVGTYTYVATGKGNYTGTKSASFTIARADLSGAAVAAIPDQGYTGSAVTPAPTVTLGGRTLSGDTDYTVSYKDNVNVGTATLTVAGKGNYSGSKSATFRIVAKSVSSCTVALSPASYTYDGTQKTPAITVKDGSTTLTEGTHYTVSWPGGRKDAGTYTVTVAGKGSYSGEKTATFAISAKGLSSCTVALSPASYTYDGTQKTPSLTVKDGSTTLTEGTHYTVSWPGRRTDAGTYTVTVTGKGNYTGTKSASFVIEPPESTVDSFEWGKDNWYFNNTVDSKGDPVYFPKGRYIDQINSEYRNALASSLDPADYDIVFTDRKVGGTLVTGWINRKWNGSCYGMSSLAFLSKEGLVPYSRYKRGATMLHQLTPPMDDMNVSSLITYYQMIQVRDVIWNEKVATKKRSHEQNIKTIIETLKSSSTALVCYRQDDWGGHAVLAYGYEYGSWTKGGITYDARILICDPNRSMARNEDYDIYFNTRTYRWAIPHYSEVRSSNDAYIEYVGADVSKINEGGYLSGTSFSRSADCVARLDTLEISENRSVTKVQEVSGKYMSQSSEPGEIEEDYSFVYTLGGSGRGTPGYNLYDAEAAYRVRQSNPDHLALTMRYEDYLMSAGSAAGESAIFDNDGYVEVSGQAADYTLSITSNGERPTDWHNMTVAGEGADEASLEVVDRGYILESDNMLNVSVEAHNKEVFARTSFSTAYGKAYIYEIDSNTIGVSVDSDGNGSFETVIADGDSEGASSGVAVRKVLDAIESIPDVSTLRLTDEDVVADARSAYDSLTEEQRAQVGEAMLRRLTEAEAKLASLKKKDQVIIASDKVVQVGKTVSLGAKRTVGDGKLTYKSSKTSIATVDSKGVVTGKEVGKAIVTITAKETANYKKATEKVTVTVKAANTLTAKAKKSTVAVAYSKVKSKNQTLANNVVVSDAVGAVSYANASSNATAKKFKVNEKNGKVTVSKGTKKGKYKLVVKVTAAGDGKHMSKSVKVPYVVKVK